MLVEYTGYRLCCIDTTFDFIFFTFRINNDSFADFSRSSSSFFMLLWIARIFSFSFGICTLYEKILHVFFYTFSHLEVTKWFFFLLFLIEFIRREMSQLLIWLRFCPFKKFHWFDSMGYWITRKFCTEKKNTLHSQSTTTTKTVFLFHFYLFVDNISVLSLFCFVFKMPFDCTIEME